MELSLLTKKEFETFSIKHPLTNFQQTINWGNLKEQNGWETHLLGFKNKDQQVTAASLILSKKVFLNKKIFYAPRGFLIDFNDRKLLKDFSDKLTQYIKGENGILLKIDPNIVYRVRTSQGEIIDENCNNEVVNNLKDLNYKFMGFNKYFETTQPRWVYKLSLDTNYETIIQNLSKSTRKNIESSYKKGVKVRRGEFKDIEVLAHILDHTAERKNFINRPISYYKNMHEYLNKYMTIYISYIDTNDYYNNAKKVLIEAENNLLVIKEKMQTEKVGNKLKNKEKTAINIINKYKKELNQAEEMKQKGDIIDVGALLSIISGNEFLSLFSGIDNNYREFNPKYALYDQHIKDAIGMNLEYVNFYGITGDFDKNSAYYGIYEFKKGFNGNVVELIGEFDLIINRIYYILYKLSLLAYTKSKKIIKAIKRGI